MKQFGTLSLLVLATLWTSAVSAVTCTSVAAGGNWSAPATWAGCTGGSGTPANTPGAADIVVIANAASTVTVDVPAAAASLSFTAGNLASTLVITSSLNVTGAVVMNAPTANVIKQINVGAGTLSAASITVNGGSGSRANLVTVSSGSITVSGNFTFAGTAANARLTSTGASTINVGGNFTSGGTLTTGNTGTINFNGAAAQSIGAYTTYNNITLSKSAGTATLLGNTTLGGALNVNSGTLTVGAFTLLVTGPTTLSGTLNITSTAGTKTFSGVVTINSGGALTETVAESIAYGGAVTINAGGSLTEFGAATMTFAGNFQNNGSYTSSTGVHTFNGLAAQTISGTAGGSTTFGSLTLNNAAGLVLGNTHNVTVNTTLTLTAGSITTNASTLTLASGSAVAGVTTTKFVEGNLSKPFPVLAGATTRVFEVGTTLGGSRYAPVSLAVTGVTTAGYVTVSSTAGSHPQLATSGIDTLTPNKLNRYWKLGNGGIVFTSYNATFTFVAADVDAGANPLAFVAMRYAPAAPATGTWSASTVGTLTATSIQITGQTGFGDFAAGEAVGYSSAFGRFNAYDTTVAAGSLQGAIKTKVAGSAFGLTVVHLNPGGTALATFGGGGSTVVTVDLIDGTTTTGAFTNNCWASWLAAPALQTTTVTFTNNSTTSILASFPAVANAYPDVRVRITGGAQTGCSGDRFAIRPAALVIVSVTDNDWQSAGSLRALDNTGASGGVVHKAGQPFSISATAQNSAGATALNYSATPGVILSSCAPASGCPATPGNLTLGSGFVAGVLNSSSASYDETGAFNLQLQDISFASVDAADTPANCTATGSYICSAVRAVGRFVPDHFSVTPGTAVPANDGFTYFGQDGFITVFTLTAQDAANTTTSNYSGAGLSTWNNFGFTATGLPTGATLAASATVPGVTWSNGAATVSAKHLITRPTDPAAVSGITVSTLPVDADGVSMISSAAVSTAATPLHYGRINIANASGSELLGLVMPVKAQYCNAVTATACSSWLTSTSDSVTSFSTADVTLGNLQLKPASSTLTLADVTPSPAVSVTLNAGTGSFRLRAPGAGKTGSVDVTVNAPGYLPSNTARASFGVYKGNDKFIDLRESY